MRESAVQLIQLWESHALCLFSTWQLDYSEDNMTSTQYTCGQMVTDLYFFLPVSTIMMTVKDNSVKKKKKSQRE